MADVGDEEASQRAERKVGIGQGLKDCTAGVGVGGKQGGGRVIQDSRGVAEVCTGVGGATFSMECDKCRDWLGVVVKRTRRLPQGSKDEVYQVINIQQEI